MEIFSMVSLICTPRIPSNPYQNCPGNTYEDLQVILFISFPQNISEDFNGKLFNIGLVKNISKISVGILTKILLDIVNYFFLLISKIFSVTLSLISLPIYYNISLLIISNFKEDIPEIVYQKLPRNFCTIFLEISFKISHGIFHEKLFF